MASDSRGEWWSRGEWDTFEGLLVVYDDVVRSSKAHRTIWPWRKLPLLSRWTVLISAFAGLEMTFKGIYGEGYPKSGPDAHSLHPLFQSLPEPYRARISETASKWLEKTNTSFEDLLRGLDWEQRKDWFYLPLEKRWDLGSMWNPGHVLELWGIVLRCWAEIDGRMAIVDYHKIVLPNYLPQPAPPPLARARLRLPRTGPN